MAEHSAIEWTDATWNPITGCSIISPGCAHCYAMNLAGTRLKHHHSRAGLTIDSKAGPVWNGKVRLNAEWLDQPLRWTRPRMIFVCAHGDLFHESVPDEWIDKVFAVMALAPQHNFQVLTKRSARMRDYLGGLICNGGYRPYVRRPGWTAKDPRDHDRVLLLQEGQTWPLPNVWLGVSTERQTEYDERKDDLRATPAAIRFFSMEPLLGPIVADYLADWIIAGGESGTGARPMHPNWPRALRDQCASAGVPFFFKQWGEYLPVGEVLPGCGKVHGATAVKPGRMKLHYGGTRTQAPKHAFSERGVDFASTAGGRLTFRVGKKAAGRLLDGVEHNAMPEARHG